MSKDKTIILPEELRNAPRDIREAYIEKQKIDEELENHPLRYYDILDRHGEVVTVDCGGIWKNNIARIKRLNAYTKEAEYEIKRRSKIVREVKMQKGAYTLKINRWLKGNTKGRNVLEFRKDDILEAFGEYKNIGQVTKIIKDWGFNISHAKISEFYYAHLDDINDRRARFQAREKEYYLATGTGRIESLSYLYTKLLELFESTKHVKYASEIRAIIEQVRKEVKGDEIRLTVDGKIDITATIQANRTIQELNQKMPINMFIVSLVAAKKGIDPRSIMSQLGNSFYKNYNGFSELKDDDEEMKLPSHFINNYDWQEIEKIHQDKEDKATSRLMERKMTKILKEFDIKYDGNLMNGVRQLEQKLRGQAVPEIVDVEPLEVEVVEEKKPEVSEKRRMLQELLDSKKKKTE